MSKHKNRNKRMFKRWDHYGNLIEEYDMDTGHENDLRNQDIYNDYRFPEPWTKKHTFDPVPIQDLKINMKDGSKKVMAGKVLYFAYGSNMDVARLAKRIKYKPVRLPVQLKGWDLAFNKKSFINKNIGYANIRKNNNEKVAVCGWIFLLKPEDVAILDQAEGVPFHYKRIIVNVRSSDGREFKAITYVAEYVNETDLNITCEYFAYIANGLESLPKWYQEKVWRKLGITNANISLVRE